MTTENFTKLDGVLERPLECRPFCLHEQESTLLSDGMRVEPTDCCELPDA